jgi:hypothetical protein
MEAGEKDERKEIWNEKDPEEELKSNNRSHILTTVRRGEGSRV